MNKTSVDKRLGGAGGWGYGG